MQVLPPRQEVVLLPLDEATILSRESGVFPFANSVEGIVQVPQDVELVVEDLGVRGMARLVGRGAEGLPHVEDDQADSPGFLGSEPGIEGIEAGFGAVGSAKPDG